MIVSKRNQSSKKERSLLMQSSLDAVALLVVMMTTSVFFYLRGSQILEDEMRTKFMRMAAIAAISFDGDEIEAIQAKGDPADPNLIKIIKDLKRVRGVSNSIEYAYILHRTDDPMKHSFFADADMLSSDQELDANMNGIVEDDEMASEYGDLYDITDVPAMQDMAFKEATMDEEATEDQWGMLISAYAPIPRSDGSVDAFIGIDIRSSDFAAMNTKIFSTTFLLFALFGITQLAIYIFWQMWVGKSVR